MAKNVRGREEVREDGGGYTEEQSHRDHADQGIGNGGGESAAPSGDSGSSVATKGRTYTEKAEAFSRLASIRASNALDAMRGISHLANAKQYAFTRDQIDKMLGALSDSVEALRKGFEVALEQAERPMDSTEAEGRRRKRGARQNFSIRV